MFGKFLRNVTIAALLVSVTIAFVGVICRYVFNASVWWLYPTQEYSYLVVVFFGAAYAIRERLHIKVEVVQDALGNRTKMKLSLKVALQFIALFCSVLLAYFGYLFAVDAWGMGSHDAILKWLNLGLPKSMPCFLGVVGVAYYGIYLVQDVIKLVKMSQNQHEAERR
jgi:TRAP-type C4-dicarboxylate transport system permease small subunit